MQKTDDGLDVVYIPPNFKEGVSFFGFMVKPSRILQAVPPCAVIIFLIFFIGKDAGFIAKLVLSIVLCAPVILVAMTGINGDSLYAYIRKAVKGKKARRTLIYNPRVKTEVLPLSEDPLSVEMLPREKILAAMEKRQVKKEAKTTKEDIDLTALYFEDDIGLRPVPEEYMTYKEKKNLKKK